METKREIVMETVHVGKISLIGQAPPVGQLVGDRQPLRATIRMACGLLLYFFLLIACAAEVPHSDDARGTGHAHHSKRELRIALAGPAGPFDPALVSAVQLVPVFDAYETLVARTGNRSIVASIAARWKSSGDQKVWTFALRRDRKFSDGSTLDAEAVKFAFDRLKAIGRGSAAILGERIDIVEIVDPFTVRLRLAKPTPMLLELLANPSASIVNPAIASEDDPWGTRLLSTMTRGSGPYHLRGDSAKGTYFLEINQHWAPLADGERPFFEQVSYFELSDPTVRRLALEKGDIDIALLMPTQEYQRLLANPAIAANPVDTASYVMLAFNEEAAAVANPCFREALDGKLDRAQIVSHLRNNLAREWEGPEGASTASASACRMQDGPDAAGAGPTGAPIRLIYPAGSQEVDTLAQYIQAQMATLGRSARLERLAVTAYLDRMDRGNYDIALFGFVAEFDDPFATISNWFNAERPGALNPARYREAKVQRLLAQSEVEANPQSRDRLNEQAMRIAAADRPYLYLYQNQILVSYRRDIVGLDLSLVNTLDLNLAALSRRANGRDHTTKEAQ